MTTNALLLPYVRQREFSPLGTVLPGAKLTTYVAGSSSTKLATYNASDLASGHENTNPIVADAFGLFGPIYPLFGRAYNLVMTDANDNPIWSQDNVTVGGAASSTFDITAYGATPGGTVDCLTAIQAAIDAAAAAGGGIVFVPLGIWRVSGQLVVQTSYVTIEGQGAGSIIQFDDANTTYALKFRPPVASVVVSALLASDANIGDRTIVLAAGQGVNFVQGAWLYVDDAFVDHGSFITYIESISTDTLTLRDAVPCLLTTAQAATAYMRAASTAVLQGCGVKNLTARCVTAAPTLLGSIVSLFQCHAPLVQNVAVSGCRVAGIYFFECDDGKILACESENAITSSGSGTRLDNSTNCSRVQCVTRYCQFGHNTQKSPKSSVTGCQVHGRQTNVALGRGIKLYAGCNFSSVVGNVVSDPNLFGCYIEDSAHCTVSGNTVLSTGASADTLEHGIQIGGNQDDLCHNNTIIGNTFDFCFGYGVSIAPTVGGAAKDLYNVVVGNVIRNCKSGAILVFGANRTIVQGNMILQDPSTLLLTGAIQVSGGSGGPSLCNIQGNSIFSVGGAALVGISTDAGAGNNTVLNNQLGPGVTLSSKVGDLLFSPTPMLVATVFETAARFGVTLASAGANTFGASGAALDSSSTISSAAGVTLIVDSAGGSLYVGSPRFTAKFDLTTLGTDVQAYVGVGNITTAGAGITFTDPHAGFKIVRAASGTCSLFATQAAGGVETASAALTTVAAGDALEVMAQLNGSASVEYYWRKNGSAWSPATILTATFPAAGNPRFLQASVSNAGVATQSVVTMHAMSYAR